MPLYACDDCGFTSAAFRVEAVSAHRMQCPECTGSIRIVFRSDDRRRNPQSSPGRPRSRTALAHPRADRPRAGRMGPAFEMREQVEPSGAVRLSLLGDLDGAVAERFANRVTELSLTDGPLRLDLSELAFIDSTGLAALLVLLARARSNGRHIEVDRAVSSSVERAARIVGVMQALWPESPSPTTAPTAAASGGAG